MVHAGKIWLVGGFDGTHYYNEQLIYDHIGISPGMFDNVGWGCDSESVAVWTEGTIAA